MLQKLRTTWTNLWQSLTRLASKPATRITGLVLVLIAVVAALVYIPRWQSAKLLFTVTENQRFDAENEARRTLAQIILGLGGAIALYLAWRRVKVAQDSQLTERFTKAIDQLAATDKHGSPAIEIRLGGIYALERIARDSEKDHWTVMEVLTAYVRKNAAWKDTKQASSEVSEHTGETPSDSARPAAEPPELPIDIQAILTVLARRERSEAREQGRTLNLAATDLRRTDLRAAHLEQAYLRGAHLEGAYLTGAQLEQATLGAAHLEEAHLHGAHLEQVGLMSAHLEGADLMEAHLERANLIAAQLEGAVLMGAHLEGADLRAADLKGAHLSYAHVENANLSAAHLEGADLHDVHLEGAPGLTQEQLDKAHGNSNTTLPDGLTHPAHWSDKDDSKF